MRILPLSASCLLAFLNLACGPGDEEQSNDGTTPGPSTGGAPTVSDDAPGSGGAPDGTSGGSGGIDMSGGTGGVDGGGGGSGGGGDIGGVGCAGADLLCETFEGISDGDVPTGGPWVTRDASCAGQGNFSMGVSGDNPRGTSAKALKVTNHSYASCRLAASFDTVDDFWVRAFIFWEEGVDFGNKEALAVDLHPPSGLGKDDPAVRFGDRHKEPCVETAGPQVTMIGFPGGEVTGCDASLATPKGKWYCFEAHVRQSGNLLADTYIDGTALSYESKGKPQVETMDLGGPPGEKVNHLRLGFFTHDSSGTGNVYIDDVAVSTTRIGCSD